MPLKVGEEDDEEVTASLTVDKEISMDAAEWTVL